MGAIEVAAVAIRGHTPVVAVGTREDSAEDIQVGITRDLVWWLVLGLLLTIGEFLALELYFVDI